MIVDLRVWVTRTVHEDLDPIILSEDKVVEIPSYGKPELFKFIGELLHPEIPHKHSVFPLSISLKLSFVNVIRSCYTLCLEPGKVPVNEEVMAGPDSSLPKPSSVAPVMISWKPWASLWDISSRNTSRVVNGPFCIGDLGW